MAELMGEYSTNPDILVSIGEKITQKEEEHTAHTSDRLKQGQLSQRPDEAVFLHC